jgi:site-specific DNA-methyltransferase (adenine-specific)
MVDAMKCYRCNSWPCGCADGQTIIHGDCRELLPVIPDVDVVLTDPPWLARTKPIKRRTHLGVAKSVNESLGIGYGSIGDFDAEVISKAADKCSDIFVICGFKELGQVIAALEPIRGVFIWHKPNGGITVAYPAPLDTAYIAWGARGKSKITGYQHWRSCVFSFAVPTAGCISSGERILTEKNGPAAHPAQGPVALYAELLKPGEGSVLDLYVGTGTTLVACKKLGRQGIGIEKEERYCEIAANRLRQSVLDFGGDAA